MFTCMQVSRSMYEALYGEKCSGSSTCLVTWAEANAALDRYVRSNCRLERERCDNPSNRHITIVHLDGTLLRLMNLGVDHGHRSTMREDDMRALVFRNNLRVINK